MSKPTVTLTFAGDEKRLTDAMNNVGAATKKLGDDVGASSKKMQDGSAGLEKMIDRADTADTRMMGFRDTITGLQDTFKGFNDDSLPLGERLLTLGAGFGDLASGLANYLLPVMGTVATFMKTQLVAAMTFVSSHPLMTFILLLTAAIVFLISQTDWFKKAFVDAFNAIGQAASWVARIVSDAFMASINWIRDRWNDLVDWFNGLPRRIGEAFSAVGRFIGDAFKAALNLAIDIINWFVDRANDIIYGINVVSPFDDIPYIGHIRRLHSGGIVPGAPGTETMVMLQAGEQVISANQARSGGGTAVTFNGDLDSAFATAFMNLVRTGQIQIGGA